MNPHTPHGSWRRAQGWAFVQHSERTVLLNLSDPRGARPILLEGPATSLWLALERESSIDGLSTALAHEYGLTTAASLVADVVAVLSELQAIGLVESPATLNDAPP